MLTVAKPVLEVSAGTVGYTQRSHLNHGRTPTAFRSASVRRVLAQVAARPFAFHSDADLRDTLKDLNSSPLLHGAEDLTEDHQAAVFALVDESVSRRMGAWRPTPRSSIVLCQRRQEITGRRHKSGWSDPRQGGPPEIRGIISSGRRLAGVHQFPPPGVVNSPGILSLTAGPVIATGSPAG